MAVAMELASQVITAALMMALPAAAGYWGDLRLGTSPWLVVAGAIVGLSAGMLQLLRGASGKGKRDGAGQKSYDREL